jgi:phenylacetate-CoA ligase
MAKHLLKLRARRACGLQPWDRVALFQEDAPETADLKPWTRAQAFTIHRPIAEILPDVRRFAPTVFYGFPGYFARLAEAARGTLEPRLIFTSGELLDPVTRRTIEAGFGAPVLDVYGCTEVKEVAWECPAQAGHHLNADWVVVETDPPGAPGKLLVTPLHNRAMPLLRYEVGDTGEILEGRRCACGRGLPLIRPTLGRSVDYLALPDGTTLAPYSLTCAVEAIEGMRQYQFVQTRPDRLELRVVPTAAFGADSDAALRAALAPVVPGVEIQVDLVPAIPPEPSGKYRIVQSRIGAGAPAEAVP